MKYRFKRFAGAILIYILGVFLIASIGYIEERERFLADIDKRLLAAASNIPDILPEDFHDIARTPDAISYEQDQHNLELMSLHTKSGDLTYLYSYVMVDGAIYFTACNYTEEDIKNNKVVTYWTGYPEGAPEYFEAMTAKEPIYVTAGDTWGLFRTILMPMTSPSGLPYVAAADMDITVIENSLKHAVLSIIGMSIVLLAIAIPLILAYRSMYFEMNTELLKLNKQLQTDIDQALSLERELKKATHNANRANKIKGQFLSNMSHELRTPINGISGMNQLLFDTHLTEEQEEYIEMCNLSAQVLLDTVNQILDVAAIEAGGLKLQLEVVDSEVFFNDIVVLFTAQVAEEHLDLVLSLTDDVPASIVIDPVNLRKVLINLIGNAIKFTHSGGIRVVIDWQDGYLQGEVQDTGMGIPDDDCIRIFETFQQADNSYARAHGGTGLGLPISRQICELMGGELYLQQSTDQGSTFKFFVEATANTEQSIMKPMFDQPVCVFTDSEILRTWFLSEFKQPCFKSIADAQDKASILDLYAYIMVDSEVSEDDLMWLINHIDHKKQTLIFLAWAGAPTPVGGEQKLQRVRKPVVRSELVRIMNDSNHVI